MIKIGILDGTIGGGVIRLLESKGVEIQQKWTIRSRLRRCLLVHLIKLEPSECRKKITQDPDDIINDPGFRLL